MLRVSNLNKRYRGFSNNARRLLAGLSGGYFGLDRRRLALDGVSLELRGGQALGLIGRNGAGKSTLLKIIAGVLPPDSGDLQRPVRTRAILELGVGFNAELSGEENAYYNGLLWGESPATMRRQLDAIFEFAGLEEFRRQPLLEYSSGMAMRLGFALATAVRPDLLLVDEALAVGDAAFQQKCLARMREYLAQGSALLIVSHDLSLMSDFCDRIIVLERGRALFEGEPAAAVEQYMHLLATNPETIDQAGAPALSAGPPYDEFVEDLSIRAIDARGGPLLLVGEEAVIEVRFRARVPMVDLTIGFHIENNRGQRIFGTNTRLLARSLPELRAGQGIGVRFLFPANIAPGKYSLATAIHRGENHSEGCYFWGEGLGAFEVERVSAARFVGAAYLPTTVEIEPG